MRKNGFILLSFVAQLLYFLIASYLLNFYEIAAKIDIKFSSIFELRKIEDCEMLNSK